MIADFFNKPLNGVKFCKFCNISMNCDEQDFYKFTHEHNIKRDENKTYRYLLLSSQECVENNVHVDVE